MKAKVKQQKGLKKPYIRFIKYTIQATAIKGLILR
jgi:hypothetical protein